MSGRFYEYMQTAPIGSSEFIRPTQSASAAPEAIRELLETLHHRAALARKNFHQFIAGHVEPHTTKLSTPDVAGAAGTK